MFRECERQKKKLHSMTNILLEPTRHKFYDIQITEYSLLGKIPFADGFTALLRRWQSARNIFPITYIRH